MRYPPRVEDDERDTPSLLGWHEPHKPIVDVKAWGRPAVTAWAYPRRYGVHVRATTLPHYLTFAEPQP